MAAWRSRIHPRERVGRGSILGSGWGIPDAHDLSESVNADARSATAGVNHIAFKAGSSDRVDALMVEAKQRGWRELYADRYPHAGGAEHYAGWLENAAGFKVELVVDDT